MKKQIAIVGLLLMPLFGWSQMTWTVDQCMRYAVAHNHEVTQQRLTVEDYRSDKTQAVGAFLPSLHASVGSQYNFGRAIDPETNTYTNVNTFYNGYSVSVDSPVRRLSASERVAFGQGEPVDGAARPAGEAR